MGGCRKYHVGRGGDAPDKDPGSRIILLNHAEVSIMERNYDFCDGNFRIEMWPVRDGGGATFYKTVVFEPNDNGDHDWVVRDIFHSDSLKIALQTLLHWYNER